ncbi:14393_t:CDS:1, partial [Funneliformis caledonium]
GPNSFSTMPLGSESPPIALKGTLPSPAASILACRTSLVKVVTGFAVGIGTCAEKSGAADIDELVDIKFNWSIIDRLGS